MSKKPVNFDQARSGFVITPSDSDNIVDDVANVHGWEEVALHVNEEATIKVILANDSDAITLTVSPYDNPLIIKKLFSTGTDAGKTFHGLVGY